MTTVNVHISRQDGRFAAKRIAYSEDDIRVKLADNVQSPSYDSSPRASMRPRPRVAEGAAHATEFIPSQEYPKMEPYSQVIQTQARPPGVSKRKLTVNTAATDTSLLCTCSHGTNTGFWSSGGVSSDS